MESTVSPSAVLGTFFHTPIYGTFELLERALVELDEHGLITRVTTPDDPSYEGRVRTAREGRALLELPESRVALPGFIDLHSHAPQWPQAGIALDEPLDVWLDQRTFPLEARFADEVFALPVYEDLVRTFLSRGTTTCVYFASAHLDSSVALARTAAGCGQRSVVGKVVMDDPSSNHDFYRDETTERALRDTVAFLDAVERLDREMSDRDERFPGVYPAVTPRFIPSCTEAALRGLGEIARERDAYVQSHCDEGQWQSGVARERFGKGDAEALADFGLLGPKSIMAHGTFLVEGEAEVFRASGATVAHCPISNAFFGNAVCPVRRLCELGVGVGLGADVSGGFSPSLYDNIRQAVMASRMLEEGVDARVSQADRGAGEPSRISAVEALWLATKGGANALKLPIGSFEVGNALDMQVIETELPYASLTGHGVFTGAADRLERILYLATPENIRGVWVQGRRVFSRDER